MEDETSIYTKSSIYTKLSIYTKFVIMRITLGIQFDDEDEVINICTKMIPYTDTILKFSKGNASTEEKLIRINLVLKYVHGASVPQFPSKTEYIAFLYTCDVGVIRKYVDKRTWILDSFEM